MGQGGLAFRAIRSARLDERSSGLAISERLLFRVHFWSGRFCRLGIAVKSLISLARPTGIEPVFPP
jgi:hypothetical protein